MDRLSNSLFSCMEFLCSRKNRDPQQGCAIGDEVDLFDLILQLGRKRSRIWQGRCELKSTVDGTQWNGILVHEDNVVYQFS